MENIISHINESKVIQTNEEHQLGVATWAARFADDFGCGDIARIMGLLHDKGKEQAEWQKYIQGVTGYNPKYCHIQHGPNHAYVGGIIANRCYKNIAPLIAQPIVGHHRGLYDYCDYVEEMKRDIPQDVHLDEPLPWTMPNFRVKPEKKDFHHIVRMMFSCLVDADSLDTEAFMSPEQANSRGNHTSMQDVLDKLQAYIKELKKKSIDSDVNRIRNYVQEQCIQESLGGVGFYSLTVPTGGGKTLSSVLWALHHAVNNGLKRIIIAIPYTSIIVQTAATLKGIFGEENVLEHHSNINVEEIKNEEIREKMQMATENWDYPIIVTTNVQFFESLFSNKRSDCRKLHNIAKSVVILDEVQTLPLEFYRPIIDTLSTLNRIFGTSFLFTTASQPILSGKIKGCNPLVYFEALPTIKEIIPEEAKLYDRLRRVKLEFYPEAKSYDEMAEEISKHDRALCIVNTRRDAKEIFERLPKEGVTLHLSRMMCPAHVAKTIREIKEVLKKEDARPIRIVATQLIEAGVDIDFPVVFRQEAGLDSILQAAGRCNREGKLDICTTYVFSLTKEHPLPRGFISNANNARINMGNNHDWFAPEAMYSFFQQLYARNKNFDIGKMEELLYDMKSCAFEEAAEIFHLIDDKDSTSVIIHWGDSFKLYEQLKEQGPSYSLMKKLSQYSVNIRKQDFLQLQQVGAMEEIFENIFVITNPSFYKEDIGLTTEYQWLEETYII